MKIYSMQATFGNLDHRQLTLKPGLNVIEAPNEWGKSTWCAFLISMLYGIDTRSKSTRHQLADKERFLPWSGSPMEGRMDLNWDGRDITIERRTKGRIPLGEFYAYETDTGLEIPELTAENCGQMLLGVEKEVFTRSGFLRFSDLPVTEDEQLRSRLNALVTTGDESGNAELLERKLKELKNRCRYHKNGLIPQLRLQKEKVEQELEEWEALDHQIRQLQEQIAAKEQQINSLKNHKTALRHRTAQERLSMLQEVTAARNEAQQQLESLQNQVEVIPAQETATKNIQKLTRLREELDDIQMEEQMLPPSAALPQQPDGFAGCTARQAVMQAQKHKDELLALRPRPNIVAYIFLPLGVFFSLFSIFLLFLDMPLLTGILCGAMGLSYLVITLLAMRASSKQQALCLKRHAELTAHYNCSDPDQWIAKAEQYAQEWESYAGSDDATAEYRVQLTKRKEVLLSKCMVLSRGKGLQDALEYWYDIETLWHEYAEALCNYRQESKRYQELMILNADAPAPSEPDSLTSSEEETDRLLTDASQELQLLLSKLGQYRGYADSLSTKETLEAENAQLEQRLNELEKTYAALGMALKALEQASAELQRRFAPRISRSAQDILNQLTNGRYTRMTMQQDFSLLIGTQDEDTLRSRHWRSDGTVDQLYLALRLAVARELLPDAPLVLDDAMVRFDDLRLQAAMRILKLESQTRQVIIFTCHGRERELMEG